MEKTRLSGILTRKEVVPLLFWKADSRVYCEDTDSVISLLSTDPPNTDSPANLDAAKEVRENIQGTHLPSLFCQKECLTSDVR